MDNLASQNSNVVSALEKEVLPSDAAPRPNSMVLNFNWAWSSLSLLLILPAPFLIYSLTVSENTFELWGQPDFFTVEYKFLATINFLAILFALVAANRFMTGLARVQVSAFGAKRIDKATRFVAIVTFVAYSLWAIIGIVRGITVSLVLQTLTGEGGAVWLLKNSILSPVSGVTTWCQLGIILGPLAVIRWRISGTTPKYLIGSLFLLAALRSLLFSERLALIEVVVPVLICFLSTREKVFSVFKSPIRLFALWCGVLASLVVTFAAFEYFRSWITYYSKAGSTDLILFAVNRLAGYYVTALNNASLYVDVNGFSFDPISLIQGQLGVPGFQGILESLGSNSTAIFSQALNSQSGPEYSNVSALLITDSTLGIVGSVVFWFALGLLLVIIANNALRGSIAALLAHCFASVGILEVVRLFYFGQSRTFPVLIAIAVLSLYLNRDASKKRSPWG